MSSAALLPRVDPEIPPRLKLLLKQFRAGESAGRPAVFRAGDALGLASAPALIGALALGGTDFAAWVAGGGDASRSQTDGHAMVLDAFGSLLDAASQAGPSSTDNTPHDPELQLATWLIEGFGLEAQASTLIDTLRAEFLITAGPVEELPQAAMAAIKLSQWALALRGFTRFQDLLQEKTPRDVRGLAAMCLHKLGRYAEAERWAQKGLGERQRGLLNIIGPVHSQADLLKRWGGARTPVVSILCTTYNHERYIESTLRGFLSQNCDVPFEILIHDDASTDATQQIIRLWQQRYPKLIHTVLQSENQFSKGVRPFELLLAKARGEFIATCEGDDYWTEPLKLKVQVGFLQAHPEYACTAHNYLHYVEAKLTVTPWLKSRRERVMSARELMGLRRLLWWPTLVFRNKFSVLPPERALSPIGDQFVTSYLGTFGPCMYFENLLGAVRRENEFSLWRPLSGVDKERIRIRTWDALVCMHRRMGNLEAVSDLRVKIAASPQGHESTTGDMAPSMPPSALAEA